MNFKVRCMPLIRTHRAARHAGRSFSMRSPMGARKSSGISNATKTRTRSALRPWLAANPSREWLGLGRIKEISPHQVERGLGSLPADAVALAGITHAPLFAAAGVGDRDVHGAHGLFGCTASRTRDTCNPDTERRACAAANAIGESD